jgi:hypothetical protein
MMARCGVDHHITTSPDRQTFLSLLQLDDRRAVAPLFAGCGVVFRDERMLSDTRRPLRSWPAVAGRADSWLIGDEVSSKLGDAIDRLIDRAATTLAR